MTEPDRSVALRQVAEECVALVAHEYGRGLDWSPQSLDQLDDVCGLLLTGGPLSGERLYLWSRLVGAYTGEVLIRAHGGRWIAHEATTAGYAVSVQGVTAMPFNTAHRILSGEPYKSLGSFVRALPSVIERGRNTTAE